MELVTNPITKDMALPTDWCEIRSGQNYCKFEKVKLAPERCTIVSTPLIEESPLYIGCRVKEAVSPSSHDVFIADVTSVRVGGRDLSPETDEFRLAETNPLVYVYGGYYGLEGKIGKFDWSVEKKK